MGNRGPYFRLRYPDMNRIISAFVFLALVFAVVGCGSGTGDNPQMPPADQRIDNNKVEFKGSNPPPTGTQPATPNPTK